MKSIGLVLILVVSFSLAYAYLLQPASASWWSANYDYRRPINISNIDTAAHTDEPIRFRLNGTNVDSKKCYEEVRLTYCDQYNTSNCLTETNQIFFLVSNSTSPIEHCNITFLANMSAGPASWRMYYLYYDNPTGTFTNHGLIRHVYDDFEEYRSQAEMDAQWKDGGDNAGQSYLELNRNITGSQSGSTNGVPGESVIYRDFASAISSANDRNLFVKFLMRQNVTGDKSQVRLGNATTNTKAGSDHQTALGIFSNLNTKLSAKINNGWVALDYPTGADATTIMDIKFKVDINHSLDTFDSWSMWGNNTLYVDDRLFPEVAGHNHTKAVSRIYMISACAAANVLIFDEVQAWNNDFNTYNLDATADGLEEELSPSLNYILSYNTKVLEGTTEYITALVGNFTFDGIGTVLFSWNGTVTDINSSFIDYNSTHRLYYVYKDIEYQPADYLANNFRFDFNASYLAIPNTFTYTNLTATMGSYSVKLGAGTTCGNGTYGLAKTIRFKNESSDFSQVNGSMTAYLWTVNPNASVNFTFTNWTYQLCLYPNFTTQNVYSSMEFWGDNASATAYDYRRYDLECEAFDNVTEELIIYQIAASLADNVQFTLRDSSLTALPGAVLKLSRYYPNLNAYKVVAAPRTDSQGMAEINLVKSNALYRFEFVDACEVLDTQTAQTISADSVELTVITDASSAAPKLLNVSGSCGYSKTTQFVTCSYQDFNTPSLVKSVDLTIKESGALINSLICSNKTTGISGTMTCFIGNLTGRVVNVDMTANIDSTQLTNFTIYSAYLEDDAKLSLLLGSCSGGSSKCMEGTIITFILILAAALVGAWNPVASILFSVGVMAVVSSIGLLVLSPATTVGFFLAGAIIVYKIWRSDK